MEFHLNYQAATDSYGIVIYKNGAAVWAKDNMFEALPYFGLWMMRYIVNIELKNISCTDSAGNNLGLQGSTGVTFVPVA